jgi:predicted PurR-regulated permease PerM
VLLPLTFLGWKAYVELHNLLVSAEKGAPAIVVQPFNPDSPDDAASEKQVSLAFGDRLQKVANDLGGLLESKAGIKVNEDTINSLISRAANAGGALAINVLQSVIGILFGLVIMVIALYYFLADGPVMIRTVMDLSPLEAEYEQELLLRFGQVSRAVVVATLLSAVVQGLLAGIGYYFALPSTAPIFLLTAATMVTAMVPFFGAAFTWVLVCGWIYLYGEHTVNNVVVQGDWVTALVLTIYSTVIVSGVDNIIKPLVLRGQSNLHPLVALLSILGGVPTLGPVGIIVGPMVVSFLQALLEMLRKEIESFEQADGNVVQVLAEGANGGEIPDGTTPAKGSLVKAGVPAGRTRRRKK